MIQRLSKKMYPMLDNIYRKLDKAYIRRTKNIKLIPDFVNRRGGKASYAEWAHVIGIFQTLIYQNLKQNKDNHILDIGCGTGLLGISAEPYTSGKGSYTGIDVMQYDIDYCSKHFPADNYNFIHFDIANPSYASAQSQELKPWPVEDGSKDLVVALSVWTHLQEKDATFYFKEVARVLKQGGRAIITFFYLDEAYQESLAIRKDEIGRFHSTRQTKWIFDRQAYGSNNWYTTAWVKHPEDAMGVTKTAMETLTAASGLKIIQHYPGNWKEEPGVYFQDVMIFEK